MAIEAYYKTPGIKIAELAQQFKLLRNTLVGHINRAQSKKGQRTANTIFSKVEETAIYRYIDYLDNINFAIHLELITDIANFIIKERSSASLPPNKIPIIRKL